METVLALAVALVLGLKHATDPDHLVAVSSLVMTDEGDVRAAVRLGAWWGVGHAAILVLLGVPLIAFKEEMPSWLDRGAETAVGVVIVVLAVRVIVRW
jgi:high-affinity nickel permease